MTPEEYHEILTALTEVERLFETRAATWTDGDQELYRAVRVIRSEVLKRESGHPFPSVSPATASTRPGVLASEPVASQDALETASPSKIRVLVVDDEPGVRAVVGLLISSSPDMRVIGEAKNGEEALERAVSLQPDVIVMDVNMPVLNGIDAARAIMRVRPATKIILFTANRALTCVEQAAAAGAVGVIFKPAGRDVILGTVRQAHAGERQLGEMRVLATVTE